MKKTLCALLLSGCTTELAQLPAETKLHINKFNSTHYSIKKSKEVGEKELIELAKKADYEEGWLFCEDIWIECGIKEKETNFCYDNIRLTFSPKNVTSYHIHPSKPYAGLEDQINKCEENIQEIYKQLEDQSTTMEKRIELISSLLWANKQKIKDKAILIGCIAFPSERDLHSSLDSNLKSHSVVSKNGVIEYSFKIKPKNHEENIEFNNEYSIISLISLFESLIPKSKNDTESIYSVVELLNQKRWIQFSFRPYTK